MCAFFLVEVKLELFPCLIFFFFFFTLLLGAVGQCRSETIGLVLRNQIWKAALSNRDTIEFKTLETNLLSAVSHLACLSYGILELYVKKKASASQGHDIFKTFSPHLKSRTGLNVYRRRLEIRKKTKGASLAYLPQI